MGHRARIEIHAKDEFWSRAFHVEWEDQFLSRELIPESEGVFLVDPLWLDDLKHVAAQTFCTVVLAPENPHRRQWMSSLIARHDR